MILNCKNLTIEFSTYFNSRLQINIKGLFLSLPVQRLTSHCRRWHHIWAGGYCSVLEVSGTKKVFLLNIFVCKKRLCPSLSLCNYQCSNHQSSDDHYKNHQMFTAFNTYWSFQINPGQTVRWKKMILWNFVATSSLLLHSKSFSKNSFVLFTFTLFSHVGAKCQCGSYLQKLKITRYFAFF